MVSDAEESLAKGATAGVEYAGGPGSGAGGLPLLLLLLLLLMLALLLATAGIAPPGLDRSAMFDGRGV